MAVVVEVAPLLNLPYQSDIFDYEWDLSNPPRLGSLVAIRFRRRETRGIVVGTRSSSNFRLTSIAPQEPYTFLTQRDVAFARELSSRMNAGIGSLFTHMLPPLGERTIQDLVPHIASSARPRHVRVGPRSYAWIRSMEAIPDALKQLIANRSTTDSVLIVTASHEVAQHLYTQLSEIEHNRCLYYISGDSTAPHRREVWNAWSGTQPCVVIGTHLATWLPARQHCTCIIVEPSHPHHAQWDGSTYHNRQILEARRLLMGDRIIAVGHSPARVDFDHIKKMPTLEQWPTILDRTADEPRLRSLMYSPYIDELMGSKPRVLFFVPHLKKHTHELCRDCATVYDATQSSQKSSCKKCGGSVFVSLGAGGLQLAAELSSRDALSSGETPVLVEVKNYNRDAVAAARIVIATAPVYDRVELNAFDCIVDLTTDFELLHPQFDSLELLWQRLRGISSRLSTRWMGHWFVETRSAHLGAWSLQSSEGFASWWNNEKILRRRFQQSPYSNLDFYNFS